MPRVLIVDDEGNIRRMIAGVLSAEGYETEEAADGESGLAYISANEPDVVLLDLALPGSDGLEILKQVRSRWPEIPVVMMSGRATLGDAVEATQLGAFHFIEKPLSAEALLITLKSALELRRQRDLNRRLREELGAGERLVGRSVAMENVRALVRRVAATDARVLITGESGTGKELVAAAIHGLSERRQGPFVRVNCAAIPRELLESEMFGHEKGAFTGATRQRRGKFELASGGTLFLDEVADLSPEAQAKLLRAIEAREIERVGGSDVIPVDVRIVAASNRDLARQAKAGDFREDLFFRLHVMPVHLPPLRERKGDIPLLVAHFMELYRTRDGLRPPTLTDAAITALGAHEWPGNVRELANAVERLMILYPERAIGAAEVAAVLPPGTGPGSPTVELDDERTLSQRLEDYERRLIRGALTVSGDNVAEAARRLHTDRPNLYRRMRRLGVRPDRSDATD